MTSRTRHLIGDLEAVPLEDGDTQTKTSLWCTVRIWRSIINSSPVVARIWDKNPSVFL
jgi:hypothetical protein